MPWPTYSSKGAQMVDTLHVNQEGADVLRHAYTLAGGARVGAFDGAALTPDQHGRRSMVYVL